MSKTTLPPDIDTPNLPLSPTAVLDERVENHLAIAVGGEIFIVFPRGLPYVKIKAIADMWPNSHIRLVKVKQTYEILDENVYYDTSASI